MCDPDITMERLVNMNEDALILEPTGTFAPALIGASSNGRAVYSLKTLTEIVMEQNGCDYDAAIEHIDFNILGSFGEDENSPVFVHDD